LLHRGRHPHRAGARRYGLRRDGVRQPSARPRAYGVDALTPSRDDGAPCDAVREPAPRGRRCARRGHGHHLRSHRPDLVTPLWPSHRAGPLSCPDAGQKWSITMPKPPIELDAVDDIDPEALDLTDEAARNDDPPWSEDDDEDTIPDDLDDDGEED